jgi:hypothetical protein
LLVQSISTGLLWFISVFVFVSRSVPADHVASLLLCLGPCLIRSREECSSTAGGTCGRARLGFFARESAVWFFVLLDAGLGSRSTMPLSASSLLVRFPFESENHAIAQQE